MRALGLLALLSLPSPLLAQDAARPAGEVFVETPTLHCLGVRWPVTGDQNEDATIQVRYRKTRGTWRDGLPLLRTRPNPHQSNESPPHTVEGGWMFAGSVFGLEPDTDYEIELHLVDPDGGDVTESVRGRTWTEPEEPRRMTTRHVVPGDGGGSGTRSSPFRGLLAAAKRAEPGTVFLLAPGVYVAGESAKATLQLRESGEEGAPIVFRGNGRGEAILDGGGRKGGGIVSANSMAHIWFEDLTFRGRGHGIVAHSATHFVVRRCAFREVEKGFVAHNGDYDTSQHHFVADNVFEGSTSWPRKRGIESCYFTYLSGSGHVVAHNLLTNVGDGIHGTQHGHLSASDFHNNRVDVATDDGIELDYARFNVRCFDNLLCNVAHGISTQPSRGGPVYVFRNVVYNATYSPFKMHNHTTGVVLYHNTCLSVENGWNVVPAAESVTNIVSRNNLFLSAEGIGLNVGTPAVAHWDLDADGYGEFGTFAVWGRHDRYETIRAAQRAGKIYAQAGAFEVDLRTCFESRLQPPEDPDLAIPGDDVDVRLSSRSQAVDRGVPIPGVNDDHAGRAPDLGAVERGRDLPVYGPR